MRRGQLIVIVGPKRVGKSTTAQHLARRLGRDREVSWTTEPTSTPFGELLRSRESILSGRAYALALAADRVMHFDSEITPALQKGHLVVTDRYVQSSLVLQRLDDGWTAWTQRSCGSTTGTCSSQCHGGKRFGGGLGARCETPRSVTLSEGRPGLGPGWCVPVW